uniref:sensor histidine kinase n=1 Tax=Persicitalea sp. TaxID=3100273 RepID=UPI0035944385
SETKVEFEADEKALKTSLPMEKRHDFFLIFKEALANAARYAKASSVQVKVEHPPGYIRLTIRDDGRGFDPASPPKAKGGNGLKNMENRAAKIGAELKIESAAGQGTCVILALPVP